MAEDDSPAHSLQEATKVPGASTHRGTRRSRGWRSSAYVMSCRGGSLGSDVLRVLIDTLGHVSEFIGKGSLVIVGQFKRLRRGKG